MTLEQWQDLLSFADRGFNSVVANLASQPNTSEETEKVSKRFNELKKLAVKLAQEQNKPKEEVEDVE